jgi:hypothetical protein
MIGAMARRRGRRAARRWLGVLPRYVVLGVLALLVAAVVTAGMLRDKPRNPAVDAPPDAVREPGLAGADLDLSNVPLPRSPFCALVDDEEVGVALGSRARDSEAYGVGDRVELADGVRDVSDEYSCTWTGAGGAEARAWVFAPAVSPRQARAWAADAREQDGCEDLAGRTTYGRPGLTRVCADAGTVTASLRGLFGDAWLTCEVSDRAAADDVRARAEQWCVHVATTIGAG